MTKSSGCHQYLPQVIILYQDTSTLDIEIYVLKCTTSDTLKKYSSDKESIIKSPSRDNTWQTKDIVTSGNNNTMTINDKTNELSTQEYT